MNCDVISTGSRGNAVLLDGKYLFDCGVSFAKIKPYLKDIRAVFLTHIHADHFNSHTVNQIHKRRPLVKFVCAPNMLVPLVSKAGVSPINVFVSYENEPVEMGWYDGATLTANAVPLVHNVENYGWLVRMTEEPGKVESVLYATDTHHIPVAAPGLDLYMVESNYRGNELEVRKAAKEAEGKFSYEDTVAASHMSHETITAWLAENADSHSKVVFLHQHHESKEE